MDASDRACFRGLSSPLLGEVQVEAPLPFPPSAPLPPIIAPDAQLSALHRGAMRPYPPRRGATPGHGIPARYQMGPAFAGGAGVMLGGGGVLEKGLGPGHGMPPRPATQGSKAEPSWGGPGVSASLAFRERQMSSGAMSASSSKRSGRGGVPMADSEGVSSGSAFALDTADGPAGTTPAPFIPHVEGLMLDSSLQTDGLQTNSRLLGAVDNLGVHRALEHSGPALQEPSEMLRRFNPAGLESSLSQRARLELAANKLGALDPAFGPLPNGRLPPGTVALGVMGDMSGRRKSLNQLPRVQQAAMEADGGTYLQGFAEKGPVLGPDMSYLARALSPQELSRLTQGGGAFMGLSGPLSMAGVLRKSATNFDTTEHGESMLGGAALARVLLKSSTSYYSEGTPAGHAEGSSASRHSRPALGEKPAPSLTASVQQAFAQHFQKVLKPNQNGPANKTPTISPERQEDSQRGISPPDHAARSTNPGSHESGQRAQGHLAQRRDVFGGEIHQVKAPVLGHKRPSFELQRDGANVDGVPGSAGSQGSPAEPEKRAKQAPLLPSPDSALLFRGLEGPHNGAVQQLLGLHTSPKAPAHLPGDSPSPPLPGPSDAIPGCGRAEGTVGGGGVSSSGVENVASCTALPEGQSSGSLPAMAHSQNESVPQLGQGSFLEASSTPEACMRSDLSYADLQTPGAPEPAGTSALAPGMISGDCQLGLEGDDALGSVDDQLALMKRLDGDALGDLMDAWVQDQVVEDIWASQLNEILGCHPEFPPNTLDGQLASALGEPGATGLGAPLEPPGGPRLEAGGASGEDGAGGEGLSPGEEDGAGAPGDIRRKSKVEKQRRGRISTAFNRLRAMVKGQGDMAAVLAHATDLIQSQQALISELETKIQEEEAAQGPAAAGQQ